MRVSDADREQVAERLREHFAAGRLTSEELDERVDAALNAKTVGDLRTVMADLPEPAPVGQQAAQEMPDWTYRPVYGYRRGPRLLPLALILLLAVIVLPSAGLWDRTCAGTQLHRQTSRCEQGGRTRADRRR